MKTLIFKIYFILVNLCCVFYMSLDAQQVVLIQGANIGPLCPTTADLISGDREFNNAGTLTINATFVVRNRRVDVDYEILFRPDNDNTRLALRLTNTVYNLINVGST